MICKTCSISKQAHWAQLKKVLADAGVNISSPLFHTTSVINAHKIVEQGFRARAGGAYNDAYWDNSVCFTRNLELSREGAFGDVTFILDASQLKSKFHTYSYDWHDINTKPSTKEKPDYRRKDPDEFEFEERVSVTPGQHKPKKDMKAQGDICLTETVISPKYIKAVIVKSMANTFAPIPTVYAGKAIKGRKGSQYILLGENFTDYIDKMSHTELKELAYSTRDEGVMKYLIQNSGEAVLSELAANPNLHDVALIDTLSQFHSDLINEGLVNNRHTPASMIMSLYKTLPVINKNRLYENATSPLVLSLLAQETYPGSEHMLREIARNEHTLDTTLAILAKSEHNGVVDAVVHNPKTLVVTLEYLAGHKNMSIRANVAAHAKTPNATLVNLARDSEDVVALAVGMRPNVPLIALGEMSEHIQAELAQDIRTPKRVVQYLLNYSKYDSVKQAADTAYSLRGFGWS